MFLFSCKKNTSALKGILINYVRQIKMASILKTCSIINKLNVSSNLCFLQVRHFVRGKNPSVARSLQQRLEELDPADPTLHYKVDIGFPKESVSRSKELYKRLDHLKKNRNRQLEKLAREKKLTIDLNDVRKEWLSTGGPYEIRKIANHYGIYKHLFGDADFVPRLPIHIHFENSNLVNPVYYGNIIKPSDATQKPKVDFESEDKGALWTLILTNPDGHLTKENSEYCHWLVGNIPGNDVAKGETIMDYLQPFPPRGTGYHRYIFILYKQTEKLDLSKFKIEKKENINLEERTFSTLDFYRQRQDVLTPASLAFFQSDWDSSLTEFFHSKLKMLEPIFEYDFPKPYIRPQEWFPKKRPFNIYMEKYQDPKKISERYFKEKLKNINPFEPPIKKMPFPNAEPLPKSMPSWLKVETIKNRLGWGRINDV